MTCAKGSIALHEFVCVFVAIAIIEIAKKKKYIDTINIMNEFVSWQQRTKPLPSKLMLNSLLSLAAVVDDRSRGRNRRVSQRVCLGHVRQVFKQQWQLTGSLHSENLRRDLQNQRVTGLPSSSGEVGVTVWDPLEFLPVYLPFVFVFGCFFQKQQGWSSVNNGGCNQTSDPFVAVATFTDFASERRRPNGKVRSQAVGELSTAAI